MDKSDKRRILCHWINLVCFQLNLQVEYCLSLGITDLGHKAIISRNRSSAYDFFEELERWKRYLDSNMIVNKYMFQLINVMDLLFATPSEMKIDHASPGSYLRIAQHRIKQVLSRAKCVEKRNRAAQSEGDDAKEKTTHFNEYKDVELYNPHVLIQSPNENTVEDMNEVDNIKYFTPFVTVWNRRVVHEAIQSPDRKCLKRLLDLAEFDSRTVSPQELYLLNTAFQLLCRWMRAIVDFIE